MAIVLYIYNAQRAFEYIHTHIYIIFIFLEFMIFVVSKFVFHRESICKTIFKKANIKPFPQESVESRQSR